MPDIIDEVLPIALVWFGVAVLCAVLYATWPSVPGSLPGPSDSSSTSSGP